ncbi:sugar-binding transcriptional regulator [Jeotgalibaca caeni]|uniref:sugar-binding transcriptional regulator n=1 Tax=Jeotgalibaca caeni TaxID=3028623 RepID=UPI00237E56A9|nr:sugar-binding transcriptional regulator [Jeotgalibaca caeni]MDE1549822.1 sugar-binding transcriptional regulator [Jeotgalibaca caeni]
MKGKFDSKRISQSVEVAKLYYIDDLDQKDIAKRLDLSRPTVSRLLQYAKENQIVNVDIHNPYAKAIDLGEQLSEKYQIDVVVVPDNYEGLEDTLEAVTAYAANHLLSLVEENHTIGIGWGKTINELSKQLVQLSKNESYQAPGGLNIVQLKGSVSLSHAETYAYQSINNFSQVFNTQPQYLPLPTIFDEVETKNIVESDRFMSRVLKMGREADIAVFSAGTVRKNALLFQLDYLTDSEKERLRKHAIGDIVSRFIDREGKVVDEELNNRTVGIQLEELKKIPHSILIANGTNKVSGVHATLTGGYCNHVIIDTLLAQNLLTI